MANNIKQRPWLLDTASPNPVKGVAGAVPNQTRVFTSGFVFRDYGAGAGSAAVIEDSRGVVCRLTGNASGTPVGEAWFIPQWLDMIKLTAIDSGVVEVIVK